MARVGGGPCKLHRGFSELIFALRLVSLSFASELEFDNPKATYGWSKYRYTRFETPPGPTDQENAILSGGDIKCTVCEVILDDLLAAGAKKDFDSILEALEADSEETRQKDVAEATTEMERYVARNKKGCNKLFKDNYLAKGWGITNCTRLAKDQNESTPVELRAPWACAERRSTIPSTSELNTYSVQMDAIHYACEATIGRNRDELAEFLSESFKKTGRDTQSLKELYQRACRRKGRCLERKQSESAETRVKVVQGRFESSASEYIEKLLKEQTQLDKKRASEAKERRTGGKRKRGRPGKRKAGRSEL